MRFGTLAILVGLAAIFLLIVGCSDDKSSNPVTYGDIQDPEFAPVKVQIDDALDGILEDFGNGFGNLYVEPGDTVSIRAQLMPPGLEPDPDTDPDTLIAVYLDGWHYVYAAYTGTDYRFELMDSVNFQVNGDPVQDPSAAVDLIHFINTWDVSPLDSQISYIDLSGRNDFQFSNLDQSVATVSGTTTGNVQVAYIGIDTTFTDTYAAAITVSNVQIQKSPIGWTNSCPVTGSVSMTLGREMVWTGPEGSGDGSSTWTVTVQFNNGSATVTASNGSASWRYTSDICEGLDG